MRSTLSTVAAFAVGLAAIAGATKADEYRPYVTGAAPITSDYAFGYGYRHGFGGGTVAGQYLAGRAALTRAQGEFNLNSAIAARYLQDAYSAHLDNEQKRVDTYFALKERNRQYVDATRRPRPTLEAILRFNAGLLPERPDRHELDPISGELYWPTALERDEFAAIRVKLEEQFERRARYGELDPESITVIREATEEGRSLLKDQIRELRPNDYLAAKRFLESLEYEANFIPRVEGVASR